MPPKKYKKPATLNKKSSTQEAEQLKVIAELQDKLANAILETEEERLKAQAAILEKEVLVDKQDDDLYEAKNEVENLKAQAELADLGKRIFFKALDAASTASGPNTLIDISLLQKISHTLLSSSDPQQMLEMEKNCQLLLTNGTVQNDDNNAHDDSLGSILSAVSGGDAHDDLLDLSGDNNAHDDGKE